MELPEISLMVTNVFKEVALKSWQLLTNEIIYTP